MIPADAIRTEAIAKGKNSFKSLDVINSSGKKYKIFNLSIAEKNGLEGVSKLPKSLKVLLENLLRFEDNITVDKKQILAIKEFNRLRELISNSGIEVFSFDDDSKFDTPDAVFPNNWISFHYYHKAILYPMFAPNRRFERESKILDKLSVSGIEIEIINDYSLYENENRFLEGTGSIVLDRKSKKAYCSLSGFSDLSLFKKFLYNLYVISASSAA